MGITSSKGKINTKEIINESMHGNHKIALKIANVELHYIDKMITKCLVIEMKKETLK